MYDSRNRTATDFAVLDPRRLYSGIDQRNARNKSHTGSRNNGPTTS